MGNREKIFPYCVTVSKTKEIASYLPGSVIPWSIRLLYLRTRSERKNNELRMFVLVCFTTVFGKDTMTILGVNQTDRGIQIIIDSRVDP